MTPRPRLVATLVVLLAAGCSTAKGTPTPAPRPAASPRPLTLYALQNRDVRVVHVGSATTPIPIGTVVCAGRHGRDVHPFPGVLSERHHAELVEAESLYGRQQYQAALAALEPAYRDEPTNPFVLEAYGRALYRLRERDRAFEVYRRLVTLLDTEWKADALTVTIDAWFVDAYWKVGTLHMDRAEWDRAAFEISRALAGGIVWERLAVDQALSYLTKAYAELGRRDIARYYAERALERNPRNTFVRRYLDPLSRDNK